MSHWRALSSGTMKWPFRLASEANIPAGTQPAAEQWKVALGVTIGLVASCVPLAFKSVRKKEQEVSPHSSSEFRHTCPLHTAPTPSASLHVATHNRATTRWTFYYPTSLPSSHTPPLCTVPPPSTALHVATISPRRVGGWTALQLIRAQLGHPT
jgi:hypothetical protein